MTKPAFLVHRRALLGYNGLTRTERRSLREAIAPLLKLPEDQWTQAGAIRLQMKEPIYLLRLDKSLRVLVRPLPDGKVEILDFVHRETLDYFKESPQAAAQP